MLTTEKITAMKKLREIYDDLSKNPITNIGVVVGLWDENDIFCWRLTLMGPDDSPYRGGLFYLKMKFPDDFPKNPPEVCFVTPIYHVNVNPCIPKFQNSVPLGHICISDLNWWNPNQSIRQLLTDIFALFYLGNPDSPYGLERADELRNNKNLYDKKVRFFTEKYADPGKDESNEWDRDWDFTFTE